MKKFLLILATICIAFPASAEVWNDAYEDSPADANSISLGAGKIRDTRAQDQRRASVEHFWGSGDGTDDDNGLQRLGSARCYMTESAPVNLQDSHSAAGSLADYLNSSASKWSGEQDLDNSASNSAGEVEDDVGHGRCWVDTDGSDGVTNDECVGAADPNACCTAADTGTCDLDDNKMYIYLGVAGDAGTPPNGLEAGWEEVVGSSSGLPASDDQILAGSHNLVYNGSFEATDGSGNVASFGFSCTTANTSTTVSSCASTALLYPGLIITGINIPADTVVSSITSSTAFVISRAAEGSATNTMTFNRAAPASWDMDGGVVSTASTPVITYVDNGADGDLRWGDGYIVRVEAVAGTNERLRYVMTNLAASTTYKVVARVSEVASDDICKISTSGALSDLATQTSAGTAWQTLSGTFTTHLTALDTVELDLTTQEIGDKCDWDHIGVYQVGDTATDRDEVNYNPGAMVVSKSINSYGTATLVSCDESYTGDCIGSTTGLTVTVTPPAPGYIIDVYGSVWVSSTQGCGVAARLFDGSLTLKEAAMSVGGNSGATATDETDTIFLRHAIVNPTPGTPIVLRIDVKEIAGTICTSPPTYADGRIRAGIPSYIEAVMIPTR